ncbi:MAG: dCTP deaminase [Thermoplasmata archaeon HGW-Thermoplasmata-1]|nr:MAG: dCTP deaminase [Thermoplasmata archaeon HGW-Thermoplasmata-1]
MAILSDSDILEFMQKGELSIEPFVEKNLTPNGYDLSIAEVFMHRDESGTEAHVKEGIARVPPLTWFAISTREYVKNGARVCSQLWIRSSYARKGAQVSFGKIEAGFEGTLTFGCFNASHDTLEIPIDDRFCQVVYEEMRSPPRALYDERSGNYQGQRGVTLAPRK